MEELSRDQLHYTVFQGSNTPKSKQFQAFLKEIRAFISEQGLKNLRVFFSYAWPKEQDNYNEAWHTNFIRVLKEHLEHAAFIISLDQIESIVSHNLNAFMQRIEQSDRVFVFGSQTRDEKLGWTKSGVIHENNLIMACEVSKSADKPFVLHIGLSEHCRVELDSQTRQSIPLVTDYLLLLKSIITETYGLGEEFEQFWQERLIQHKIMDMLVHVPAQAPNIVRRAGLLAKLHDAIEQRELTLCVGAEKSGKKQLCLNYIWENYYRYRAVYWLNQQELISFEKIKKNSLVFLLDCRDMSLVKNFLDKKDSATKVILVLNTYSINDHETIEYLGLFGEAVKVRELTDIESHLLIGNVLGENVEGSDLLLGCVGSSPEPLLLACGYIQRNRITIQDYLESYEELTRFKLRPIRERKFTLQVDDLEFFQKDAVPRLRRREKPHEFKFETTDSKLQVAPPKPDDAVKERERFEEQQVFSRHEGHIRFLNDIRTELDKLELPQKTIFISFAFPSDKNPEEKWTEVFVNGLVQHFRSLGVAVYFMPDINMEQYVRENQQRLDDIHVLVMSTRERINHAAIREQDGMIRRCVSQYPVFQQGNQRFIMPIRLTSEKHYDKYYEQFAAYSFYEHEYSRQLRDLVGFIFWVDDSLREVWRECALKHKLESNWWPNRASENPNFVDRKDPATGQSLLQQMHKHFWFSKELLVISTSGIGGAGKTQLALRFAHLYGYKYSEIFLFSAENKDALLERYVQLGTEKGLFELEEDKKRPIKERARIVINWLQNQHQGWLLIIDNAISHKKIKNWLPSQGGQILVTSRHTEWPGEHNISLGLFTREEAREYIGRVLGQDVLQREFESADKLIELLGKLPLALAQACAYIKNKNITVTHYLALYELKKKELQASNSLTDAENHNAVAVTWAMTLNQMQEEFPQSVMLMYFCTQLHHENIPEYLISQFFENNKIVSVNAIRVASEYSMVSCSGEENRMMSLHVLVQDVIRLGLSDVQVTEYLAVVHTSLIKCFPYGDHKDTLDDLALMKVLLPHLEKILPRIEQIAAKDSPKLLSLLSRMEHGYGVLSDTRKQCTLLQKMLPIEETFYGSEHLHVSITLNNLGNAWRVLGDAHKGAEFHERALLIKQRKSGLESLSVAITLYNLSADHTRLGNFHKAAELLEQAVLILKKNHPSEILLLAQCQVNLGGAYGVLGDFKSKCRLVEEALSILSAHYGPDHPTTVSALISKAIVYGYLGFPKKECNLLEQVRLVLQKIYGPAHINVGNLLVNLSNAYSTLGEDNKAMELLKEALPILEKYYGENHSLTAVVLMNLGNMYGTLGEADKSVKFLKQALSIQELEYGSDHILVSETRLNLANAFGRFGKNDEKVKILQGVLSNFESFYGDQSFKVGVALSDLGVAYGEMGDAQQQLKLLLRALSIFEKHYGDVPHPNLGKVLIALGVAVSNSLGDVKRCLEYTLKGIKILEGFFGPDHAQLGIVLNELGNAYSNVGDYQKARDVFERALKIFSVSLPADHHSVGRALMNLACTYKGSANAPKAIALFDKSLSIMKKKYGESHPEIAKILDNIGNAYAVSGELEKAEDCQKRSLAMNEGFFGLESVVLVKSLNNLGITYAEKGDVVNQCILQERALSILERNCPEHPNIFTVLYYLAQAYGRLNNIKRAFELMNRRLNLSIKVYGLTHPVTEETRDTLSRMDSAIQKFNSDTIEKQLAANPTDVQLHINAASYYLNRNEVERSIFCYEHVVEALEGSVAANVNHNLGCLYHVKNKIDLAEQYFQIALTYESAASTYCDYGLFFL